MDRLGFDWDEVHDIAEQLEHVDSVELVERLDAFLGHPTVDPHGDPIPKHDGTFHPQHDAVLLAQLEPARTCAVTGVRGGDDDTLLALKKRGIGLGSVLTGEVISTLPAALLEQLWVRPLAPTESQEHG